MTSTITIVHTTIIAHSIDIALTTIPISLDPEPITFAIFIDKNSTDQKTTIPISRYQFIPI